MSWVSKVWQNRSVEHAGRRLSVPVSGMANTYDITRPDGIEGTVFVKGNQPDATELTDLENRIGAEFAQISNLISGTLTAGQTSIKLSASWITANTVLGTPFTTRATGDTNPFGVSPLTKVQAVGSVTYTFPVQTFNMIVAVGLGGYL